MIEFFESIDLAIEHWASSGIALDGPKINNFDCNLLSCCFIDPHEDIRTKTLTDLIAETIRIILDFLSKFVIAWGIAHWN